MTRSALARPRFQRRGLGQRRKRLDRAQIGVEVERLADAQETVRLADLGRQLGIAEPAGGAEEDRVGRPHARKRILAQEPAVLAIGRQAEELLRELREKPAP